jgi:hypothetical protein
MFWGNSIDNIEPVLNHERWTPDTRWWSYVKMFGGMQLRDEKLNFIEEVIK